ncbi:Uncharacterised protein [Vibrio cholerae]|nr:Uncharacterised protein [Vibrio cholerae]CSB83466.1 Uncharacterised protein [Vibrio cholerae]
MSLLTAMMGHKPIPHLHVVVSVNHNQSHIDILNHIDHPMELLKLRR